MSEMHRVRDDLEQRIQTALLREIVEELKYANKLTKAMAPKTAHVTKD